MTSPRIIHGVSVAHSVLSSVYPHSCFSYLTLHFSVTKMVAKLAAYCNLQPCLHSDFPDTKNLESYYVTMTAVLNKYCSKEFMQLGKQVKITSCSDAWKG